jgi:hypothetical protein
MKFAVNYSRFYQKKTIEETVVVAHPKAVPSPKHKD